MTVIFGLLSYTAICFFNENVREFGNKLNWIVKKWRRLTSKSDTIHKSIQINGPKLADTYFRTT